MKTYAVDGSRVHTREEFFTELGRAVNGPGGYFGSNLDALEDCLRGGFGTPEKEAFGFVVHDAQQIRKALGDKVWATVQEIFADADISFTIENSPRKKGGRT